MLNKSKHFTIFGGYGLLGSELKKIAHNDVNQIGRNDIDVSDYDQLYKFVEFNLNLSDKFETIVVNCATKKNVQAIENYENYMIEAIDTNIVGTINLIKICRKYDLKYVHISTDYVFSGEKGYYEIYDNFNPVNKYSMTKLSSELIARMYKKSLIIRTSFCKNPYPYSEAPIDQYTSKDYVDIIAPKIYHAMCSDRLGIVHIGTERKTIFDLAKRTRPDVVPTTREKLELKTNLPFPEDTSLMNSSFDNEEE